MKPLPSLHLPVWLTGRQLGVVMALLGAVLFSAKAVIVKLTYTYGVDAVTVLAFRMLFSLPFFLAIGWHEARRAARGEIERVSWSDRLRLVGLGLLGYYLSSFLDFLGLQYVSAGLERLILFLSPTMVLLLSAVIFKRRIEQRQWLALVLSYMGVILVFAHDVSFGGAEVWLGSLFVFGSALTYAIYLIGSGELVRRIGPTRLVAYVMTVSSVACVAQFLAWNGPGELLQPAGVYGWSLLHAVASTVMPVFLIMWAVARIGAPTTALLGMIGPVSVLFMAAWFLDEPITSVQLGGTVLVMAGVLLLSHRRRPGQTGAS